LFAQSSRTLTHIRDGSSNTVLHGETMYVGLHRNYQTLPTPHPRGYGWSWASAARIHGSSPSLHNICATYDGINNPTFSYTHEEALIRGGAGRAHGQQMLAYSSWHTGGAHFCFGDGSVRFLSENMDLPTYRVLGPINDRTAIGAF